MVEPNRDEARSSRGTLSWGNPSIFNTTINKPWRSTEWHTVGRPASLFESRSNLRSPLVSWSDTSEPPTNNPFSLDVIVKEIENEFRHMKGEPVYTFGRQPTPGLEPIRDAVSEHVKALIDRINLLEAQLDTEENKRALAKKKIRQAISEGRKEALECRIKIIENILVEHLPIA